MLCHPRSCRAHRRRLRRSPPRSSRPADFLRNQARWRHTESPPDACAGAGVAKANGEITSTSAVGLQRCKGKDCHWAMEVDRRHLLKTAQTERIGVAGVMRCHVTLMCFPGFMITFTSLESAHIETVIRKHVVDRCHVHWIWFCRDANGSTTATSATATWSTRMRRPVNGMMSLWEGYYALQMCHCEFTKKRGFFGAYCCPRSSHTFHLEHLTWI